MVEKNITVEVPDSERNRLETLFGAATVERVLDLILKAGATEAIGYASGTAVFSTMTELRMYRVFCLFGAGMTMKESESLVATLFKLTPNGARRVVSSTLARYAFELDAKAKKALQERLDEATWDQDDERWPVTLPAGFVRERAQQLWRDGDQPNPQPDRGAIWNFPDETYQWLRDKVGLGPKDKNK